MYSMNLKYIEEIRNKKNTYITLSLAETVELKSQ